MDKIRVSSSSLKSVGYDLASHSLEIEFTSGTIYRYGNVPPNCFDALLHASSKGAHFAANIRDKYPFRKIR